MRLIIMRFWPKRQILTSNCSCSVASAEYTNKVILNRLCYVCVLCNSNLQNSPSEFSVSGRWEKRLYVNVNSRNRWSADRVKAAMLHFSAVKNSPSDLLIASLTAYVLARLIASSQALPFKHGRAWKIFDHMLDMAGHIVGHGLQDLIPMDCGNYSYLLAPITHRPILPSVAGPCPTHVKALPSFCLFFFKDRRALHCHLVCHMGYSCLKKYP